MCPEAQQELVGKAIKKCTKISLICTDPVQSACVWIAFNNQN